MRLTTKCSYCNKILVTKQHLPFKDSNGNLTGRFLHIYKCGHMEVIHVHLKVSDINYDALDNSGHTARDYQMQGIEFALNSNLNCIIGDQMRLGKTPQSLIAIREAAKLNKEEIFPTLIIVRSANLWQWIPEYKKWTNPSPFGIFPITGTKNFIPPGFETYIISMDTFSRPGMAAKLAEFGIKTIIADEAHSFKNPESTRSQELVKFIKLNGIEHKMFLTGTVLKNRAEEFFIPLNLCAPTRFPSLHNFRTKWLEQDAKGNWSRISRYSTELFREEIKPFYIRREKEDVYTDLPSLDVIYTPIKIEKDHYKKLYNRALQDMEDKIASDGEIDYFSLQSNLMFLRRICGMAKVQFISDYVDIFLEDSEHAKLAIGLHHEDVRNSIAYNLKNYKPLIFSGDESSERKYRVMQDIENKPEARLLICNMIAGGVGADFKAIDNVVVAERAWSPADEQQFHFRFYNPDKKIKDRPVLVEYILAEGTIDYFFHDMIRDKQQNIGPAYENNWSLQSDPGSFRELIEKTINSRI